MTKKGRYHGGRVKTQKRERCNSALSLENGGALYVRGQVEKKAILQIINSTHHRDY